MIYLSAFLIFLSVVWGQSNDTDPNAIAIQQRPIMINAMNMQRSSLRLPLLCQDSQLTSMAQQHANDMAILDFLGHDLPCNTKNIPNQFCLASSRLSGFGTAAENALSVYGSGNASMAMYQLSQDAGQYSNMMNADFLYVGVGVAYNANSNKFYWAQVFSTGNYRGVSCRLQPQVDTIDASNITSSYTQPQGMLNVALYPQGITNVAGAGKRGLYCTLIAYNVPTGTVSAGAIPYPTVAIPAPDGANLPSPGGNVSQQAQQALGAVVAALNAANATISSPNPIPMLPVGNSGAGSACPALAALEMNMDVVKLNATLHAIQNLVQQNSTYMSALNGTGGPDAFEALIANISNGTSHMGV